VDRDAHLAKTTDARPDRKPWTTLVLLGLAQFMVTLDITVVNVALPSIAEDLAFSQGDLQWVITAYVLFTGGLLMLCGRGGDTYGPSRHRRRLIRSRWRRDRASTRIRR
jgi:MFS family permease